MALELRDSNMYSSGGFIVQLEGDEQLLLRDTLEPKQEQTDQYRIFREGDNFRPMAWAFYKDLVDSKNAKDYWYLLADRNNVFDPIENTIIQGDGDLINLESAKLEVVIPNVLSQQVEI